MTGQVSAVQAGRIRDAARVTFVGGVVGLLSFFVSFVWEPAIYGFAAWPLAFVLLVLALTPLFRLVSEGPAILLLLVGVMGVIIELIGLVAPTPDGQYRIGTIFGAGTVLVGAWFVGAGAIVRQLDGFTGEVGPKAIRGGIGLGVIGISWFVEDITISLVLLLGSLFLLSGIDPLLRQARAFGLPDPKKPGTPPAEEPLEVQEASVS